MDMITAAEAARKWNVTPRRVQDLCKRGEIPGVRRLGRAWMIPADAEYPGGQTEEPVFEPLPRRGDAPFLHLTSLYREPGTAQACIDSLAGRNSMKDQFAMGIAFSRGEIDCACEYAKLLLAESDDFNAVLSVGFTMAMCAIWSGDVALWRDAKEHIYKAPHVSEAEQELMYLTLASVDSEIHDIASIPEWFSRGAFEKIPKCALPVAKVFYAGYMYVCAQELACGQIEIKGQKGLSMMQILPNIYEPMIAQAVADGTLVTEIYLRFYCAMAYHFIGEDHNAVHHIDRALALALPDGLLGIIAEQRKNLDTLLDERILILEPKVLPAIKQLHKSYSVGWAKINNVVRDRSVCVSLTAREREIARLAAFGLKNREIAERLRIAESTVKQAIRIAVYKSGVSDRDELYTVL